MGRRPRPEDFGGATPSPEKDFSRERSAENCGALNGTPVFALVRPGQADALRILRRKLDWDSSRYEWKIADGAGRVSPREPRPPCPATGAPRPCSARCASVWTSTISSRQIRTVLVARGRARHLLRQVRSRVCERIPRSSRAGTNQGCAAFAKWVHWNRELDGGRNSLAREDCAGDFGERVVWNATGALVPGDTVCRERIAPDHRSRFLRAAARLADPSKVEEGRCLSASSVAFAQGDNWRTNDRLVSALPTLDRRYGSIEKWVPGATHPKNEPRARPKFSARTTAPLRGRGHCAPGLLSRPDSIPPLAIQKRG